MNPRLHAFPLTLIISSLCSADPPLGEPIAVPTNQVLTPYGKRIDFPGRPVDVSLSPDGRTLAVLTEKEIVLIDRGSGKVAQRVPPPAGHGYCFAGIAFRGDRLYASSNEGKIHVLRAGPKGWAHEKPIPLEAAPVSIPGRFAFSGDGTRLYVPMNAQNEVWEVDPSERKVLRKFPVGVAPYAAIVAGDRLFVSNWGGRRPDKTAMAGPAGHVGTVRVDPVRHIASEGSVTAIDLKTGKPLGETVLGPHASGLALSPDGGRLYVACASADEVAVLDAATLAVAERIGVRPDARLLFGSAPNAVALSPDGTRLYVSNGTNNAVAVVDAAARPARVLGFVPVAWYPAGLLVDPARNEVVVANVKGIGPKDKRRERGWNSHDFLGAVSVFVPPGADDLAALTRRVLENNRLTEAMDALQPPRPDAPPRPVPERHGEPSVFEHVVYIIKENRTYDQVLGDMKEGDGDPALCNFGEAITPNQHALAREFVLLDRFFCSGTISADGHAWTDEAYAVDYLEKFFGGFLRSYPYDGGDALAYAPTGFLWDAALARKKTVRIYGEFMHAEIRWRDGRKASPTFKECLEDHRSGAGKISIRALPQIETIVPIHCPTSIGFPLKVTDQYRADQFLRELKEFETKGGFPNLSILMLPGDHTAGLVPGMPTPQNCVADNDLAVGRIAEALGASRFWPTTCLFVVEDDPQAGYDHVDGHRTVAQVISPYTRRGAVVHAPYNQTGMVRTIELILGLPPMNQIDASATPMRDCFQEKPDPRPYRARPSTVPPDKTNARLDEIDDPKQLKWVRKSMEQPLDEVDEADDDTLNRILWHATMGWRTRYPKEFAAKDED